MVGLNLLSEISAPHQTPLVPTSKNLDVYHDNIHYLIVSRHNGEYLLLK